VSDNYKLFVLLPNLRIYNSKDVTTSANHLRYVYSDNLRTREFFSLAWSTVLMSRRGSAPSQACSILAAGGKRGVVKLIHPRDNVAYGEFRASRKPLSVLRFNHRRGNFLFSEFLLTPSHFKPKLYIYPPQTARISTVLACVVIF
ncbi:hypothetical protein GOODEAATRI_023854, partial [Goodea atripinnis]